MRRIITIGREFGSGGRDLGLMLAEKLGIAYYDKEIITGIAEKTSLTEQYVQQVVERRPSHWFPFATGHNFYPNLNLNPLQEQTLSIYHEQCRYIKEVAAKSDCILVGRCADYILQEQKPFRIFVYAAIEERMARCRKRLPEEEEISDKELKQRILSIDKNRAAYYRFYTGQVWGDKGNYDFCVNTGCCPMEKLVPAVLAMLP